MAEALLANGHSTVNCWPCHIRGGASRIKLLVVEEARPMTAILLKVSRCTSCLYCNTFAKGTPFNWLEIMYSTILSEMRLSFVSLYFRRSFRSGVEVIETLPR